MLTNHSFVVLAIFSLIGLVMIFVIIRSRVLGYSLSGKPSIRPFYFYLAKILFFLNWVLFMIKAGFPDFWLYPCSSIFILGRSWFAVPWINILHPSCSFSWKISSVWNPGGRNNFKDKGSFQDQPQSNLCRRFHDLYRFLHLFSGCPEYRVLHHNDRISPEDHPAGRNVPCRQVWKGLDGIQEKSANAVVKKWQNGKKILTQSNLPDINESKPF